MVDRLVAVDDADYRFNQPIRQALALDAADADTELGSTLTSSFARGVSLQKTSGTLAELQAGVDEAAAKGVPLYVSGDFSGGGTVTIPSNTRIVGMGGVTITQTANLTPHFVAAGVEDVWIENVIFVGKGTDWVNTDTVYGATAMRFTGANTNIVISDCRVEGIAGCGVFVQTGASKSVTVRNTTITGVGLPTLGSGQYSAGVIVQDGIADITIEGCDISGIAQGIAIGHGSTRIIARGNRIHHTSEHGAYFATSDHYIITDNYFYNTGLLGFKIQQGKPGYSCKGAVITGNHVESSGSNSIVITNAIAPGTVFIENVVLDGNMIYTSGDTGIRIDSARAVIISNNLVNGCRFAIRAFTSSMLRIAGNMLMNSERTGLLIDNCSQVTVADNEMLNLGILGPEKVGIIIQGTVTGLALRDNMVDYDTAAHNDAVLFGTGTYSNIRIRGNYLRGANYGIRPSTALSAITVWRDNTLAGGLGGYDAIPSFIVSMPSTAITTFAEAQTAINALKTLAVAHKDARP